MTAPLSNLRFEKKFVATGFTLAEVLARVLRHPAAFRETYPERLVNNLYLDSPSRRGYHDHVNGIALRTKTRVRWYGSKFEATEGHALERKLKRGMVSGKESYKLPPLLTNEDRLCSRLGAAFATADLPPNLRAELMHLETVLFNRYRRRYFLNRDRNFRLTVDFNLQFAGVRAERRSAVTLSPPTAALILELKYGSEVAEDAHVLTNAFPFRVARFSKYIAGIEHLGTA